MMTLTPPERHWPKLCQALGHPELEKDPRFVSEETRDHTREELVKVLDGIFATRARDEWLKIFDGYDLFCCSVNRLSELIQDPQVTENDYLVDFDHPTMGKVKIPGYPVHFSESFAQTTSAAPDLGEHTEEVLLELGGYDRAEIARFREEGIV